MHAPPTHFSKSTLSFVCHDNDVTGANEQGSSNLCHRHHGLLLAHSLFLVSVAVSLLREALVAEAARVRFCPKVGAHVVLHIRKLAECLRAGQALEVTVHAVSALVPLLICRPLLVIFLNLLRFV